MSKSALQSLARESPAYGEERGVGRLKDTLIETIRLDIKFSITYIYAKESQ